MYFFTGHFTVNVMSINVICWGIVNLVNNILQFSLEANFSVIFIFVILCREKKTWKNVFQIMA